MALFRLISLPSTLLHPQQQLSSPATSLPKPTNSTSFPSLSLSSSSSSSVSRLSNLSPLIKTQRPGLFLFNVSSSTQAQSTTIETPTPQLENSINLEQVQVEEEEDESSRTRLIVQNVPFTCTADDIRPLFEKYGTVLGVQFMMYNKTRNRGLAFITMGSHEEAVAALTNLQSYEFDGRTLNLDWAKPRKKNPPRQKVVPIHNLYVTNIPYQARAKHLREFFNADKRNVVSAEIIFDKKRRSTGYGFVCFNTQEEAEAALSAFQGKEFMGRPIRVAHSKRFLSPETKATIEDENGSVESNPDTPQSDKADEVEA
ncbi:hypothetical protein LguiB_019768 [Lonicera macranthoides]